mmetsp:Transcript_14760/g.43331  ORF Transcript_14760/g.43331 Transcript_14760/m.43331 type:complete len:193 (-) Transcript_14760:420-998(-)
MASQQQPKPPGFFDGFCKDPSATMSILSFASGVVLFLGGLFGVLNINILRAMTAVYSMVFGLVIVVSECKHVPLLSVLYRQLEFYAHFLVYPRGKAVFFVLVGILTFFAHTEWALPKIASLIVVIVGALHFLASFCYKQPAQEAHFSPGMGGAGDAPDLRSDAQREAFNFARSHPETAAKGANAFWSASRRP